MAPGKDWGCFVLLQCGLGAEGRRVPTPPIFSKQLSGSLGSVLYEVPVLFEAVIKSAFAACPVLIPVWPAAAQLSPAFSSPWLPANGT